MKKRINLENFASVSEKDCDMKCNRDVVVTPKGAVVVCYGCNRIVMDNRE